MSWKWHDKNGRFDFRNIELPAGKRNGLIMYNIMQNVSNNHFLYGNI